MAVKPLSDGRWQAEINRGDMPRKRKRFDTRAAAEAFEQEYIKANQPQHSDTRKLMELVDLWYELHGSTLSNGDARYRLLQETTHRLKNPIAIQLDPADVLRYRNQRLKTIKAKTWNNQLGLLKSIYNKLLKFKQIDYPNPISGVDPMPLDDPETSYLNRSEIEKLLNEISKGRNPDTWWVTQICLRTGARWREAERLTRKQLDNNRVTYLKTKTRKGRTVPIHPDFFQLLLKHIGHKGTNQRIFQNCMKAFEHAVKRSGIVLPEGQSTHICRHTFASHFMMQGGNILTLQKILGHTRIEMTLRYAHLAPEYLADAIKYSPLSTEKKSEMESR